MLADEGIALKVEKNVAVGWLGQTGEPEARFYRQQLEPARARRAGLHDGPRSCLTGELRVDRFVGPSAQPARHLDAAQNVSAAVPALTRQRALGDHRDAAAHGCQGFANGPFRNLDAVDADDFEASLHQVVNIALLVGSTSLVEDLEQRIPNLRLRNGPFRHRPVQGREMMAVEVTDQVGRCQSQCAPHLLHEATVLASGSCSKGRIGVGLRSPGFVRRPTECPGLCYTVVLHTAQWQICRPRFSAASGCGGVSPRLHQF